MSMIAIKPQNEYADLIAEFKAKGGEVTQGQPVHAPGNEASRGLRKTVTEHRRAWRKAND